MVLRCTAWSWRVLIIKGIQLLNNTYNYNTKKIIVLENIWKNKNNVDSQKLKLFVCLCLHLHVYIYNVNLSANHWNALTNLSTQAAIFLKLNYWGRFNEQILYIYCFEIIVYPSFLATWILNFIWDCVVALRSELECTMHPSLLDRFIVNISLDYICLFMYT